MSIGFQPFVFGMVLGLIAYLMSSVRTVSDRESEAASGTMLIFIGPLLAKLAIASGHSINDIIAVGPAMLLQELGNLGTIFLALPAALILGFKREAVGMTHSIGREQNMGLMIDKYGFNSDETRGVLTIYIVGTVIGSVIIGPLTSLLASVLPLSPLSYAMATGVGSAGMTAASLGTLIDLFPKLEAQITAYSSMSNLLTQVDGIYMSVFIGLPLCNFLYRHLEPVLGRSCKTRVGTMAVALECEADTATEELKNQPLERDSITDLAWLLFIFSVLTLIVNTLSYGKAVVASIPGLLILTGISFVGIILTKVIPLKIPAIIYISLIALIISLPVFGPIAGYVFSSTNNINTLGLCTVILTYSGIAVGKNWLEFKKMGWKGVVVTVLVIVGTFLGSAIIAEIVLKAQGLI